MDQDWKEVVHLLTSRDGVTGDVALLLQPGMRADAQRKALDRILATPLSEVALELDLVLAARPSSFAFGQPGKDAEGRTRFFVRGRREGDRLVPAPTELSAAPGPRRPKRGSNRMHR